MSGILTTVLFCPEDLLVLKAGAAARRRFLDQALCQLRPRYEAALTEYSRILEQKAKFCGTGLKIHLFCKCCRNIPTACARLGPF